MLKLFGQTDKIFTSNGDLIIQPTKAIVSKEDGAGFYLDLETSLEYVDEITEGRIIVAPTPQGEQAFRIHNPTKTKHKIQTRARHIFYDAENYLIADSNVVERDCNYAMDHLNSATDNLSPFTTVSDINVTASYRCVRKSLLEAVQDVQSKWGGFLIRDNWDIKIMSSMGRDNGVVIRYSKNLKDISCEETWTDVCTKLLPVGKDGLLLPEVYLNADVTYPLPYTKTISFDQSEIVPDDYTSEEAFNNALIDDLRTKGNAYLAENCVPKLNYTLSANVEKLTDIGDTILVQDERIGVDVLTNVISYQYDCISERYIQLQFGNFKPTLSGLLSTVSNVASEIATEKTEAVTITLGESLEQATSKIWSALGDSHVIYGIDAMYVVDSLPKEQAHNVIMINSGGIALSNNGLSGPFVTAWTIDGKFNAQAIDVINFTANMIKGGTLKLGSLQGQTGTLELYGINNNLIGKMDADGLKMYGQNGSYVQMNNQVGFAGFDRNGVKIFWADQDEFHMRKSVVEEEITLCGMIRYIPITLYDSGGNVSNIGIAMVSSN